ncbi:MAG: hypothetical protein K2V38_07950 [Gemmataceae bacterium]|nr:hypothetical protein [Gemmataceae bacterium]
MAKGGGSWKVAYADFVTAMMAFFLVMWIGAQDVKVRQSVANYFIDPSGVSKRPAKTASVLDATEAGPVPEDTKVIGGRGTRIPTSADPPSPGTAAVMNWIGSDPQRAAYWKGEAERCRAAATARKAVNDPRTPEDVAVLNLKQLLEGELGRGIPETTPDVSKDLLYSAFKEVNWELVAKRLLGE